MGHFESTTGREDAGDSSSPATHRSWADQGPATPVADVVRVRIRREDYETFRDHLVRDDGKEYAGYLLAGTHRYRDGTEEVFEYLVREVHCPGPGAYTRNGHGEVVIGHDLQVRIMHRAGVDDDFVDDCAVLFAHSHPWSPGPRHSSRDDANEPTQMQPLAATREGPHGSLLFGAEDTVTGRAWPADPEAIAASDGATAATPIDELVVIGGHELTRIRTTDSRLADLELDHDEARDRQALVHSEEGNDRLRAAHVAVVGAGGLGSIVVQDLAKMGVGTISVADPDVVETSNLSRIAGADESDAGDPDATPGGNGIVPAQWADAVAECGRPKVDVMADLVERIDSSIDVRIIPEVAQEMHALEQFLAADVIVTATDTHLSRRVVSNAAQQYMRPLFDVGTDIKTDGDVAKSITTRLTVSGPGRYCLDCAGVINPARVQAEVDEDDPYAMKLLEGEQPSVISVNREPAQRASFALQRYLAGLWTNRGSFRTGKLDFGSGRIVPDAPDPVPECRFCGADGSEQRAAGDRGPALGTSLSRATAPTSEPAPGSDELTGTFVDQLKRTLRKGLAHFSRGVRRGDATTNPNNGGQRR